MSIFDYIFEDHSTLDDRNSMIKSVPKLCKELRTIRKFVDDFLDGIRLEGNKWHR